MSDLRVFLKLMYCKWIGHRFRWVEGCSYQVVRCTRCGVLWPPEENNDE